MEETLRAASDNSPVRSRPVRSSRGAARGIPGEQQGSADAVSRCADALQVVADPSLPIRLRVRTSAALVTHLDAAATRAPDDPRLHRLASTYDAALHEQLLPGLVGQGHEVVGWDELNSFERLRVIDTFDHQLHPLLTPMTVDAAHPFPRVPDRAVNVALRVCEPSASRPRFVCITLPPGRPRFVSVHAGRVMATEAVVRALLPRLVAGVEVVECTCFRVTRSPRSVVRLELEHRTSAEMAGLLSARFAVPESRIHRTHCSLAMGNSVAELHLEGDA